jgi:hypothetical protein
MTKPVLFSIEQLEMAFDDLKRLIDATFSPGTEGVGQVLDDLQAEVTRLLVHGLTKEELALITAAEVTRQEGETP